MFGSMGLCKGHKFAHVSSHATRALSLVTPFKVGCTGQGRGLCSAAKNPCESKLFIDSHRHLIRSARYLKTPYICSVSPYQRHYVGNPLILLDEMILPKLPFAFHALIETAAALSFIFNPKQQLPGCNAAAKLILCQYGGLLLSTNLICIVVLTEPGFTHTAQLLAAALGTYHIWPCYRAYVRICHTTGTPSEKKPALGGPRLHLIVHLACLGMFIWASTYPEITSESI
ncbi:hypothetical protein F4804DRAFT_48223 [Jackrogersella minutella]|nr:hypothetical protein F4804DRAFT_48223 [Jackrogersella minutella]